MMCPTFAQHRWNTVHLKVLQRLEVLCPACLLFVFVIQSELYFLRKCSRVTLDGIKASLLGERLSYHLPSHREPFYSSCKVYFPSLWIVFLATWYQLPSRAASWCRWQNMCAAKCDRIHSPFRQKRHQNVRGLTTTATAVGKIYTIFNAMKWNQNQFGLRWILEGEPIVKCGNWCGKCGYYAMCKAYRVIHKCHRIQLLMLLHNVQLDVKSHCL